jgi:hypothetical protein
LNTVGKTLGLGDLGIEGKAGGKGGYNQFIKEKAEKEKKFGESLQPSDIEKDQANEELRAAQEELKSDPSNADLIKKVSLAQEKVDKYKGVSKEDAGKRNKAQIEAVAKAAKENLVKKERLYAETHAEAENRARSIVRKSPELDRIARDIEGERRIAESMLMDEAAKAIAREKAEQLQNEYSSLEDRYKTELQQKTDEFLIGDATKEDYLEAKSRADRVSGLAMKGKERERDRELEQMGRKAQEIASAGDVRKRNYAEEITTAGPVSTKRRFFVGAIQKENLQAAADLRKGGKKVEDIVKEAMKKTGELKEEDDKPEPETHPATPTP